jgi:hypothetical protein
VASFVVTGPYAWDSTLLGALLLLVLIGYGRFPLTSRETIGMAAAAAFAEVFLVGRFIDVTFAQNDRTWLTDWPIKKLDTRENLDIPNPDGGLHTLLLWCVLLAVSYVVLIALDTSRGRSLREALRMPAGAAGVTERIRGAVRASAAARQNSPEAPAAPEPRGHEDEKESDQGVSGNEPPSPR